MTGIAQRVKRTQVWELWVSLKTASALVFDGFFGPVDEDRQVGEVEA